MLDRISRTALAPSIVPTAIRCSDSSPSLQQKLIGVVLTLHPNGYRKWLQRVTAKSPRTCDYWLSGDTKMGGDAIFAITRALRTELDEASKSLQQFELDLR